jgi:antitoxin VapB
MMGLTAKIFMNGRSQAIRLPAAFRFEEKEVFIRRDEKTGDLILSRKPENWDSFFLALKNADVPSDFLSPKDRNQSSQERDPFDGINE